MTIETTNKLAKHLCRLLKITEVTFPIARTPKGNLGLTFNVNNDEFIIMLDSVPLSTESIIHDEDNIELRRMVEKYWFDTGASTPRMIDVVLEPVSHAKDESEPVSTPMAPKKHGKKTNA